jgi:hypothetical protein
LSQLATKPLARLRRAKPAQVEGLPETFFDYDCVPQESRTEVYELTKSVKDARRRHLAVT